MSEVGPLSVWGLELASLGASSLDRRTSHHELLRGGTRGVPGASGGSLAGITAGSSLHADDCSLPCCSLSIESEGSSRLAVPRCGRPRSGCDLVQSHSGIPAVPEQFGVLGGFVRGRAIGPGVLAGAGAKLAGFKIGASRDDLRGRGRAKTRSCRGSRGLAPAQTRMAGQANLAGDRARAGNWPGDRHRGATKSTARRNRRQRPLDSSPHDDHKPLFRPDFSVAVSEQLQRLCGALWCWVSRRERDQARWRCARPYRPALHRDLVTLGQAATSETGSSGSGGGPHRLQVVQNPG